MARFIPLTQGKNALVDDEDYGRLVVHKWCYARVGYAHRRGVRQDGTQGIIYMHREILNLSPGDGIMVDHANQDTLDYRKTNLRI